MEGREYPLFAAGCGLAILHVLDDTFVGRQPGTSVGDELFSGAVVTGVLVGAILLYPRLRAGLRALLALTLGVLIATAGAMHVAHIVIDEPERSDFTGVLALLGGLLLIGLSIAVAWRSRKRGALPRRIGRRALVAVGLLALGFFVLFPLGGAIYVTRTPREPIDGTFSVRHEDVSFRTADGLTIRGWYAPSRNGAAIVFVHGSGGNRQGPRKQAALLAEHGYGVLLYDSRGRGESEGDPQGFDWTWQPDIDAAIEFLDSRPDVRGGRIGGVGLSAGAEALVEAAARRPDLRAVVAEGAGVRAYGDAIDTKEWLGLPYTWMMFAGAQVLSAETNVRSVGDYVGEGEPNRVLLIAAGKGLGSEDKLNPIWADRAKGRVLLWELPESKHTGAIDLEPEEYERRVVGFFNRRLLGS
ncbi:MAG TPA: alpha/beta fold hydrolase [Gaiellaceae bacterium]